MPERKREKQLILIYKELGLRKGDTVFIHARLLSFGKKFKNRAEFCRFFLDPLLKIIGPGGTIVMLTYTFNYSSFGETYIHKKTPSEAGMLTEYFRTRKDAVRSFHPFCSFVAIGKKKNLICDNITRSAWGWGSVFFKLHQLKAKVLYLGMTVGDSCSFLHYVEQMYGVSHCYNKAFFYPAYKNGKLIKGPFLAFLRNRKSESYNYSKFQEHLRKKKMIKETIYNGAPIQLLRFEDCFNEAMKVLDKDPCFFIKKPFYITE